MAPPTGEPIRMPRAPQNMLIPKRVPIVAMLVVNDATAAPCKLTKAPEQNPYKKHQTARPAVLSVIAIQQKASKVAAPVHAARTCSGWKNLSAIKLGRIRPGIDPTFMIISM